MAFWCQVWLDQTSPSLLLERPESGDISNRVKRVHEWILNELRLLKFETKETPCLALCECQTDDDSDRDSDSDGEISNVNNLDYEAPQECPRHMQSDSESQKTWRSLSQMIQMSVYFSKIAAAIFAHAGRRYLWFRSLASSAAAVCFGGEVLNFGLNILKVS